LALNTMYLTFLKMIEVKMIEVKMMTSSSLGSARMTMRTRTYIRDFFCGFTIRTNIGRCPYYGTFE
jgi:hypothetical protein